MKNLGAYMKKIFIFILSVFVITSFVLNIECQDVLVKIRRIDTKKASTVSKKSVTEKKNNIKENNVRIVLKDNSGSSIYHNKICIQGKKLNIYYGKKICNKGEKKKITISLNSSMFDKNNIVKVEAANGLKWLGHNEENGSPKYKGMFYIYKENNGLVIVNDVSMKDYIAAVISSEIGVNAPIEALKTQAVCARTYILNSNPKEYRKYNATADDSTDFQVYNRQKPNDNCIKAAKETTGLVMFYKNKLINAYYFSTSCGYTTDYRIWGKDKKYYLKSCDLTDKNKINVKSDFDKFIKTNVNGIEKNDPYYRWNVEVTKEQLKNSVYRATGASAGEIKRIEINSRGSGGIASQITIYGTKKQIIIKKQNDIRKALCSPYAEIKLNDKTVRKGSMMLPSAFIYIEEYNGKFKIYGGGFGHGSGMSQNAAIEMAKQGKGYKEILKTFYYNVEIKENI